jgi:hypothetical protein
VLFRNKSDEERRYFEVTPARRWAMAACYFGLIGFLVFAMNRSRIEPRPDAPVAIAAAVELLTPLPTPR